ncbi:MAG: sulfonate transport system permease protein [Thermosediminibacterales bacterium]|nr:sulfonate transport system permease protein [Thermosediminibacterales bacterium]
MKKLFRYCLFVASLILIWECLARSGMYPEYLFPSTGKIFYTFIQDSSEILLRARYSLTLIFLGLGSAVVGAVILAGASISSKMVSEAVTTLMAIMHPLPGIALFPIALLWFGIGNKPIVIIIAFSALWPLIANIYNGLRSVPVTQLEAGKILGLSGSRLIFSVMIPAALPNIITGLRVGWARAWQALVAAEMVFGASGGEGGLGWLLYKRRFMMQTPGVFAGLLIIIIIGIIMENAILATVENQTIRKWKTTID